MSYVVYVTQKQYDIIGDTRRYANELIRRGKPKSEVLPGYKKALSDILGEEKANLIISHDGHLCVPVG